MADPTVDEARARVAAFLAEYAERGGPDELKAFGRWRNDDPRPGIRTWETTHRLLASDLSALLAAPGDGLPPGEACFLCGKPDGLPVSATGKHDVCAEVYDLGRRDGAATAAPAAVVDDGEVTLAPDGDGWALTVATDEDGSTVTHLLTGADVAALFAAVATGEQWGVQYDPGSRVRQVWNETVARREEAQGATVWTRLVGPWQPAPAEPEPGPGQPTLDECLSDGEVARG